MLYIQWIGYLTIIRKELNRIFRIWTQTLLPSVVTTTLYFLIFGRFVGSRVGDIGGHSYIEFIIPGLIMMQVLTNTYANMVSAVFSAKFQRQIEELLVSPLAPTTILLGYMTGSILRGVIVGGLVTVVSLFFAPIQIMHFGFMIGTIFLTAIVFSLAGFLNAIFAKKFDDIAIVPTFILTPLTYLGGVFYSVHALPLFWQKMSLLNPILYLVNLFRYGFLGITDIPIWPSFAGLIILTVVLWSIGIFLFSRGIGIRQ